MFLKSIALATVLLTTTDGFCSDTPSNNQIFRHWFAGVINFSEAIELEDGSNWKLAPPDAHQTLSWSKGDLVAITPNYNWFFYQDYQFCITNQKNGSSIHANLALAPASYGPYTHWVTGLDRFSGHLFTEDGTHWIAAPDDWDILGQWDINDFIIVGLNDGWTSCYDHILINVKKNKYIRAKSL